MSPPRPRRRFLRLSLRAVLALVAAVALGLGSWINAAHSQRDAVAGLRAIDPRAVIDYDVDSFAHIIEPPEMADARPLPWWAPRWAYRLLGRDYFRTVTVAHVGDPEDTTLGRSEAIIGHLARLRRLQRLTISYEVDDADVARVAHLTGLRGIFLTARSPRLTDRSLAVFGGFGRLDSLWIGDAPITDSGVAGLGRLPRLQYLDLGRSIAADPRPDAGVLMTGHLPADAGRFPALTILSIRCRVPEAGGLALLGAMPAVTDLRLEGPSIRDDDLRPLAPLRRLDRLQITDVTLDGTGMRHLIGADRLDFVVLQGPRLGDAALSPLARLPVLTQLSLQGTAVTAAGLEQLRESPRLTLLQVDPMTLDDEARLARILPKCLVNDPFGLRRGRTNRPAPRHEVGKGEGDDGQVR